MTAGRPPGTKLSLETKRKIAETQLINSLVKQGIATPNQEENCWDIGADVKIFPRAGVTVKA